MVRNFTAYVGPLRLTSKGGDAEIGPRAVK